MCATSVFGVVGGVFARRRGARAGKVGCRIAAGRSGIGGCLSGNSGREKEGFCYQEFSGKGELTDRLSLRSIFVSEIIDY